MDELPTEGAQYKFDPKGDHELTRHGLSSGTVVTVLEVVPADADGAGSKEEDSVVITFGENRSLAVAASVFPTIFTSEV